MCDCYPYDHVLQVDHVVRVISASRGLVHGPDHVLRAYSPGGGREETEKGVKTGHIS